MAAVDATNPNATASTIGNRRSDMVDSLLILRDITDGAESTTAAEAGVSVNAEKLCYYKAVVHHNAIGGTVDGSNYWTLTIEASDNNSDWVTIASRQLAAAAARYDIAIEGEDVASFMAASGENEAIYMRVVATETGTTAGDLTYGAHLTI